MTKHILLAYTLASGLALSACGTATAPVSASTVSQVLVDTELFCQAGPLVAALAQASGSTAAPIIAKGASSAYLQGVCAAVGGFAVSPPADASSAPVLVVPSVRIPLKA